MSPDSLERRVQELEDRRELEDLGIRYFLNVDDYDEEGVTDLFTSDGSVRNWEGNLDVRGQADLRTHWTTWAYVGGGVGRGDYDRYPDGYPKLHCARGQLITEINGDSAAGIVTGFTERGQPMKTLVAAYRYYDTYRREAGRWRFQDRLVPFWYKMYLPDLAGKWSDGRQSKRIHVHEGKPATPGDLPFAIETWVRSQWWVKLTLFVSGGVKNLSRHSE